MYEPASCYSLGVGVWFRRAYASAHSGEDMKTAPDYLKEYAAIALKVPMSGNEEIDAMIKESLRNDFAAKALEGLIACSEEDNPPDNAAYWAYKFADAMLKASEEG